jgi:hypothetical protein
MTVRDWLSKRKRISTIVGVVGWGSLMASVALTRTVPPPWYLIVPGMVAFFAAASYLVFFLRCPRCRGPIGNAINYPGGFLSVSPRIRFCPFCGVALDSELEART